MEKGTSRRLLGTTLRIGAFLVCTGSSFFVLVQRPLKTLRALHQEVASRQAALGELRSKATEIERFEESEKQRLAQFLDEVKARLPASAEVHQTYDAVNAAALKGDAELVSCQVDATAAKVVGEDGQKSKLAKEVVKIKVSCPYQSLGPLLSLLVSSQRSIRIDWIDVKRNDDRFPKVAADIQAVGWCLESP